MLMFFALVGCTVFVFRPLKMAASSPYPPVAFLPSSSSCLCQQWAGRPGPRLASLHPIRIACRACDVTSCLTSHMHGQTCGLDVGGVDCRTGRVRTKPKQRAAARLASMATNEPPARIKRNEKKVENRSHSCNFISEEMSHFGGRLLLMLLLLAEEGENEKKTSFSRAPAPSAIFSTLPPKATSSSILFNVAPASG